MKPIVIIEEKNDLNLENPGYFVIGIDSLSEGCLLFSLNEALEIVQNNSNIIVSLNKIMHNYDLVYLDEVLETLDGKVAAFIIYDYLFFRKSLKSKLIYGGNYFVVNGQIIRFLSDKVAGILLNNEISMKRQIELQGKSEVPLIPLVAGKTLIGVSKRPLKEGSFEERFKGRKISVKKKASLNVFDDYLLNKEELIPYFEYGLIRLDDISDKKNLILNISKGKESNFSTYKGFLNKETFYEVKK